HISLRSPMASPCSYIAVSTEVDEHPQHLQSSQQAYRRHVPDGRAPVRHGPVSSARSSAIAWSAAWRRGGRVRKTGRLAGPCSATSGGCPSSLIFWTHSGILRVRETGWNVWR